MAENEYIQVPKVEDTSSMKEKKPKKQKEKVEKTDKEPSRSFSDIFSSLFSDPRLKFLFGIAMMLISATMFFSFTSHFFSGHDDYDVLYNKDLTLTEKGLQTDNEMGSTGSWLSDLFIKRWFGIGSFLLIPVMAILGFVLISGKPISKRIRFIKASVFSCIWISLLLGFVASTLKEPGFLLDMCGGVGYHLGTLLNGFIGWGTFLLLSFILLVFFVYFFDMGSWLGFEPENEVKNDEEGIETKDLSEDLIVQEEEDFSVAPIMQENHSDFHFEETDTFQEENIFEDEPEIETQFISNHSERLSENFEVEQHEEKIADLTGDMSLGSYDPTLDLSRYKYPTIDLLDDPGESKIQVSKEELEANKNRIVETLGNYKIGIASIKATIGPTVTLYEIVPEAGVKISKIKNLEDDIALSLAALGIRIIAPIPGKGTIGIEVPNKEREMVSFRSLLTTEKFVQSKMALPVVMGKTITNEVFMIDLAKMPHILMAGATGQGKSVGLNIILASLLYKKHPAQLKFVLVDPKKVELSIFAKIERHFLAKLPGEEEAIITDTSKVVNTLNSLCIEMDARYDLLKLAGCRNLKEYNGKFTERSLNPEKGHKFLPYIVLVIDELADLMMTAGKEVETPIARLAQLARAIGIHLVVATQRPSVNVITGIIKANFPARVSFKVTSAVDSKTILDTSGANQLIGMGDMLFSQGSDIVRVQCGFVDTPEIENIVEFIGEQQGYSSAYMLPEYVGEGGEGGNRDVDLSDRDSNFDEAARLIVTSQQGSTSLIQRKMKLGYARAGRIMDQLEMAGVVGPFQGAKAREVLITDLNSLEQLLRSL